MVGTQATGANQVAKTPSSVEVPRDQSAAEMAMSPVASVSSHVDPYPHYIMAGASLGGSVYQLSSKNNPRMAAAAGGFALLYFLSGRMVFTGSPRLGYDLGTVTSLGLVAAAVPAARATGDAYAVSMSALGGISTIANFVKSYQYRTNRPKELVEKH